MKKKDRKIFLRELKIGLSQKNKVIPSKFHYDLLGSQYFEKITKQKDYYPTIKEKEILKVISKKIKSIFDEDLTFIELGSGSVDKIRILLNKRVKFYIPLDISFDFIEKISKKLKKTFPKLKIKPMKIDYSKSFTIPKFTTQRKVCFFLGSSIGNFHNNEEKKFLKTLKKSLGKNNYLFVGVDLIKNKKIIERAYNDKKGFSAKFNLNLITRMNKEFNTKLKINDFFYQSKFNNKLKCIEGFVISKKKQSFYIGKTKFFLRRYERIQTEISKKFTLTSFKKLANSSRWKTQRFWLDKHRYFAIFLLQS